jgi:prefoldin subunit 5
MTTDERLERIEQSIENLARTTENLARSTESNFQNLTRYVLELRTETTGRLEIIENRLEVLAATFSSLDSRLVPLTKAILEFGVIATRLQREQTRIAKLVDPAA